jgi:integrase/recombinase XerC
MRAIWAGRTERTIRAYERDYRDFARFLEAPTPEEAIHRLSRLRAGPANALVLAYRVDQEQRGLKPATVARRLSALTAAVKIARTMGRVSWSLETPAPKVETTADLRGPGLAGFARMLDAVERSKPGPKHWRDRAILLMLWSLALRRSELAPLDLADVDLTEDHERVAVIGKGRSAKAWLTLAPHASQALREWLVVRGTEPGALFYDVHGDAFHGPRPRRRLSDRSVHRIVSLWGKRAHLKRPVRPHDIRHAAITECAKRTNGDAFMTQKFGRHRSPTTTARCIDATKDTFGRAARLVDGSLD